MSREGKVGKAVGVLHTTLVIGKVSRANTQPPDTSEQPFPRDTWVPISSRTGPGRPLLFFVQRQFQFVDGHNGAWFYMPSYYSTVCANPNGEKEE
jgi:hypothetical protein